MTSRDKYLRLAALAESILNERKDPTAWMQTNLQIRTKDRRVIPLIPNAVQAQYVAARSRRDMILKARQVGITTVICALFFHETVTRPNTASVIVAHDRESTELIFRIVQLFWRRLPRAMKDKAGDPHFASRREFFWPMLNSQFYIGAAGAVTFGRGQTINNLHCCEFAFWPKAEESIATLLESVPADGRVVIESTANGIGNHFHTMWRAAVDGESQFKPHFFPWFREPQYRLAGDALGELQQDEQALRSQGLDDEQIRWRRGRQREIRDRFAQEYPEDDVTCFLTSGRCVFETQALRLLLQAIAEEPPPRRVGSLDRGEDKMPLAPAHLLAWKYPQEGRQYVIGADVGEGLPGGDASVAEVLDRETGEQVAELHGRVPPDRFGHMLDRMGRWYKYATIGVERNNHGHSTLNTLRNVCRYPRLYYYMRYDRTSRKNEPVLGWPTDASTKPILVDDLASAIAGEHVIIHSPGFVDECFTFVSKPGGAQEAEEGKYDDRVMAMGIAWQVRKRGVARGTTERPEGW